MCLVLTSSCRLPALDTFSSYARPFPAERTAEESESNTYIPYVSGEKLLEFNLGRLFAEFIPRAPSQYMCVLWFRPFYSGVCLPYGVPLV